MIDFNFLEIGLLLVLAILIFGPEKLPELARKAARILAYLRRIGNDARGQLRRELGPEFDDLHLSDLNPKTFVQRHLLSGDEIEDLRQIREEAVSAGTLVRDTVADADATLRSAGSAATSPSGPAGSDPVAEPERVVPFDPEAT